MDPFVSILNFVYSLYHHECMPIYKDITMVSRGVCWVDDFPNLELQAGRSVLCSLQEGKAIIGEGYNRCL